MTSVADDLRSARALIDSPSKWGKGDPESRHGTRCAAEAIEDAIDVFEYSRGDRMQEIMKRTVGGTLTSWNDAPERTHADVMAAFDAAIAAAEVRQ